MAQGITLNRTRVSVVALVALLGAFLATAAFGTSPASAQLPAICDDYPNLDICIGPVDEVEDNGDQGPGVDGGENPSADNGDGTLPFTGYPLTSLILLLLILLLTGLAIRSYISLRERLRDGPTSR